jgi:hypothetical protein
MADWITDVFYRAELREEHGTLVLVSRWSWLRLPQRDAKVTRARVSGWDVLATPYRMR